MRHIEAHISVTNRVREKARSEPRSKKHLKQKPRAGQLQNLRNDSLKWTAPLRERVGESLFLFRQRGREKQHMKRKQSISCFILEGPEPYLSFRGNQPHRLVVRPKRGDRGSTLSCVSYLRGRPLLLWLYHESYKKGRHNNTYLLKTKNKQVVGALPHRSPAGLCRPRPLWRSPPE